MKNRAQSVLEYVIVLGLVGMALGAMQIYFKRGIQGVVKVASDQIGAQQDGADKVDVLKGVQSNSRISTVSNSRQEIELLNCGGQQTTERSESSSSGVSTYEQQEID